MRLTESKGEDAYVNIADVVQMLIPDALSKGEMVGCIMCQ